MLQPDPEILEAIFTDQGEDLLSLSHEQTLMLVFLRHFGCSFCRETMSDIAELRPKLEAQGLAIVMVHMAEDEIAEAYFKRFNLAGIRHISDPDLSLYEYFGLTKGSFWQLYGLKIWVRGFKVGFLDGQGLSWQKELGEVNQMPGIFLLAEGQVRGSFIHESAADRPDYLKIVDSCQLYRKKS